MNGTVLTAFFVVQSFFVPEKIPYLLKKNNSTICTCEQVFMEMSIWETTAE